MYHPISHERGWRAGGPPFLTGCDSGCDSGGLEFNHFWLDVTKTSKTSITSGFCTDVTLDVHFQGATLGLRT